MARALALLGVFAFLAIAIVAFVGGYILIKRMQYDRAEKQADRRERREQAERDQVDRIFEAEGLNDPIEEELENDRR